MVYFRIIRTFELICVHVVLVILVYVCIVICTIIVYFVCIYMLITEWFVWYVSVAQQQITMLRQFNEKYLINISIKITYNIGKYADVNENYLVI